MYPIALMPKAPIFRGNSDSTDQSDSAPKTTGNVETMPGDTLLSNATTTGNLAEVQRLAQSGIDLDEKNADGTTAIHRAILYHQTPIIRYLIEQGADVIPKSDFEPYLFAVAYATGNREAIDILVDSGRFNLTRLGKFFWKRCPDIAAILPNYGFAKSPKNPA